jgi:hypothetical protein
MDRSEGYKSCNKKQEIVCALKMLAKCFDNLDSGKIPSERFTGKFTKKVLVELYLEDWVGLKEDLQKERNSQKITQREPRPEYIRE